MRGVPLTRPFILTMLLVVTVLVVVPSTERDSIVRSDLRLWESSESSPTIDPVVADLQERTFRFFWDTANRTNGLIPDRYPTPSYASIAAVGFALTTYPIGV